MNTGTNNKHNTPMIKIDNFSLSFNFFASICENALGGVTLPCKKRMAIKTGINADTILGRIKWGIVDEVEIFPLTQSMIVVTSQIGDQAPPLFAAIIMILPNTHRSL